MIHWIELATAMLIYLVVLIVPGPNMVIVYNYSINRNSVAARLSGLGYGIAATVLALLSYLGISALQGKVPFLEEIMFIISGSLLIYFGYKITVIKEIDGRHDKSKNAGHASYILSAFMLNISNPKAIALLTSIYGGVLSVIYYYEAIIFMVFCFVLEVIWYYWLDRIFSGKLMLDLSSRFIGKITYFSKTILIGIGGYFLIHSVFAILISH